jgi:putative Ca2+/H+ antiporter (TMEM165/GDT1 family)
MPTDFVALLAMQMVAVVVNHSHQFLTPKHLIAKAKRY